MPYQGTILEEKSVRIIGIVTVSASLLTLHIGVLPFLRRFSGAPYVSSSVKARSAISEALRHRASVRTKDGRPRPRPRMIDMGSGSGEIVLDAARSGFAATGYELNTWLVALSRWRAWKASLPHARFVRSDMWSASLHGADAIVVFGVPGIMDRIGAKVANECPRGCLVCCNSFPITGWRPMHKKAGVWFYDVGNSLYLETEGFAVHGCCASADHSEASTPFFTTESLFPSFPSSVSERPQLLLSTAMSPSPPSASFRGPPPHFTLNSENNRQVLTRKLAVLLLKPLSENPYQTIVLSGSAFGDAAATVAGPFLLALAHKQCLHTVILSDIIASLPSDEALRSLSSIASSIGTYKRLRAVDLSHNAIGPMGMAHCAPLLQGQTSLEVVNLEDTGLSADAARLLCKYLTTTTPTVLRGLNFHGNRLESDGMLHIATVVSKSPCLQCLRVSSVGASPDAVISLANALIDTPNLCEIDISDNGFDDASATALAKALANQTKMIRVVLSDLNMSNTGFHEIASSLLKSAAPLTELRLSGNELGPEASNDIAKLLTIPASQLAILDLSTNELGDDGIHRIAEAIDASSPSLLCKLNIAENEASSASIIHLASSLVRLTSLVQFDFTGNNVSPIVSQRIASVFPPTVVTIDDEWGENNNNLMDHDADTEVDIQTGGESVDGDSETNQGPFQANIDDPDELENALRALESVARTQQASRMTEDVSSPRPHADVSRLVSFFSKLDNPEHSSAGRSAPNQLSFSDQEDSKNLDSAQLSIPQEESEKLDSAMLSIRNEEPVSLPVEGKDARSESGGAGNISLDTPPVSRVLGSVISPITPPSGEGDFAIVDKDSEICRNAADEESISDLVAENPEVKDGNVILSARKLKESIVSLSKEISDVAGELQMPESPNLREQDLIQVSSSNTDAEENVNDYLFVDREGGQTKCSPFLSIIIDCVGGCLVALFVVVIVLAIAQSQEESTFPFRPL